MRRLATIVSAFAIFSAAAIFVWTAFNGEGPATGTPAPASSGSLPSVDLSIFPEGWTELAAPPQIRTGAAQVWTGSRLLVWGGGWPSDESPPKDDGFFFDASSGTWGTIPPAPIDGRKFPAAAWTGQELVVWGGWEGSYQGDEPATLDDGAAYDPSTGTWRKLSSAGLTARAPLSVWTGDELIVWGTMLRTDGRPLDGAAYDPDTDAWRPIADGPIELTDATAAWTGSEMLVFGAALHGGNVPETPTAIGAAYDPSTDTWRQIPDSDIDPNANTANWLGNRLIAWDYSEHTSAYSPSTGSWTSLAGPPVDACEDTPVGVTAEGFILGELCGELVVMGPGEDRWHNVSRRDLPFNPGEFVPARDVAFVMGYQRDYSADGSPTMFVYRSPNSFTCGGFGAIEGGELAGAVAARFELLRSDRPEKLSRPEIEDLLSAQGEASYDGMSALPGLFDNVALDQIMSVEPLADGEGFQVAVRMYNLAGSGKFTEALTLQPSTNLAGDECSLVVTEAAPS